MPKTSKTVLFGLVVFVLFCFFFLFSHVLEGGEAESREEGVKGVKPGVRMEECRSCDEEDCR